MIPASRGGWLENETESIYEVLDDFRIGFRSRFDSLETRLSGVEVVEDATPGAQQIA